MAILRPLRNLRLLIAYDGTEFQGWQTQPGYRTVQATLEAAIAAVIQEQPRLNVSGRTDAGVHARAQVANFYSRTRLTGPILVKAINAHLPTDLAVLACDEVAQTFDANKDAISKEYHYSIYDTRAHNPFHHRFAYHHRKKLDTASMDAAVKLLLGRHDFRSFETNWPNRLSSIRTMTLASVHRERELVIVRVAADGFLYNMVRGIAGTLMKIGRGEWPPAYMAEILAAKDRRLAGPNAPPEGLTLAQVNYADGFPANLV